ncbi:hypothetical protein H4R33_003853 [Dimargaris cristalligena]|uniref:BED-type domain-containing protein n=1 Tax=Dimargaris cristalligena TaxID=215637 RepID=A0A4Q0A1J4_9FUNG|nr:hypothetical protein H4R33_003853 [Dimargaris cristalligena]RKP39331.1 hypothetical protein BJ085DRAFT_36405 [Dimargaris cristalligena]|eukprot:RKP39331.1 hypothetical protein BJ085DRAFT_36405 [Dimargaris cristalligena]
MDTSEFPGSAADIVAFPTSDDGSSLLATTGEVTVDNTPATARAIQLLEALNDAGVDFSTTELTKTQIREKIISGEFTLHPPPPSLTSQCWDKFCFVRETATDEYLPFAACRFCHKVYRYRGKENSTTSMNQHRCKINVAGDEDGLSLAVLAGAAPTLTYEMRQALLKSCVNFICRDDRQLNMVADNVFLELLQTAVTMGSKYGQFSIRDVMSPPSQDASNSTLLYTQNGNSTN